MTSVVGLALLSALGSRWGWVGSGVGAVVGMLGGFALGRFAAVLALAGIGSRPPGPSGE